MGSGEALAHTSPTPLSLQACCISSLYLISFLITPVRECGQPCFLSQSRCEVWDCSSQRAGLCCPVPKPSCVVALMFRHTVSSKWQGGTCVEHVSLLMLYWVAQAC